MTSPRRLLPSLTRIPTALLGGGSVALIVACVAGGWWVLVGASALIFTAFLAGWLLIRHFRALLRAERVQASIVQRRLVDNLLETHTRQRQVLDMVAVRSAAARESLVAETNCLRDELHWEQAQVAMRTKDAAFAHGVIAEQRAEICRLQAELADVRAQLAIEQSAADEMAPRALAGHGRRLFVG